MSQEAALWRLIRNDLPSGHWVRVENRVGPGTPDLNYACPGIGEGWIELKDVSGPKRKGPVRVPHFTKQQRFWIRDHLTGGGRADVLIRVRRPSFTYILLDGWHAAEELGSVPLEALLRKSLGYWGPKWNQSSFRSALIEGA